MDIQVSSNFERLLFEAYGRDASAVRALMGALKQSGEFAIAPAPLAAIKRDFDAYRVDEETCAREIGRTYRSGGVVIDPHTAVGVNAARRGLAYDPATPVVALATAHPAKFPDAVARAIGRAPPCRRICATSNRARAIRCSAQRGGGGGAVRSRSREGGDVSVRFTTLPSGLRVVTDATPHLRTAALGVFVSAGSRHEFEDEHGLSHLLEHMAFKGTRRRSARDIAEAIENAGGDLNAETGVEQTAYLARVLGEDVDLALDVLADILTESRFRRRRPRPREECHHPGNRSRRGHAGRLHFRSFHHGGLARSADRPADPRHARRRQRLRPQRDRRLFAAPLSSRSVDLSPPRARSSMRELSLGSRRFSARSAPRPLCRPSRPPIAAARFWSGRGSNRPMSSSASRAARFKRPITTPRMSSPPRPAGACRRACFRRCGSDGALPIPSTRFTGLIRTPACSVSTPAPPPETWAKSWPPRSIASARRLSRLTSARSSAPRRN